MRLLWALALLAAVTATPAPAQNFPTAPVKLIVTTGAGGAPDVIARIVAEGLSRHWGQQVFVTNHPGAAGSIGMKVAGTSPPDGYTLLFGLSSSFVALPEIAKDYPYDLVRDFVSIGFVCEQPMAIAVPASLGINTLGELIDYAKKRPGEINVAVLSRGGIPHLTVRVDQAGGRPGVDLDQLSGHAAGALRRHRRPRAGDHGRPAEPRRRDQRRPAQAHRGRLGEAPAEPAGDADHRRDAAGDPARARLVRADGAARHAGADGQEDQRRSAHGAERAGA